MQKGAADRRDEGPFSAKADRAPPSRTVAEFFRLYLSPLRPSSHTPCAQWPHNRPPPAPSCYQSTESAEIVPPCGRGPLAYARSPRPDGGSLPHCQDLCALASLHAAYVAPAARRAAFGVDARVASRAR